MTEPRIYRASSLGYSLEQLVAGHLGYDPIPPPEWLQSKFDEGTALEPFVIAALNKQWDIDVTRQQLEVDLEVIPGIAMVQGHLDGIAYVEGEDHVVEVKTMAHKMFCSVDDKGWDAGGIMEKYKWQVSAYQLATGMPSVLVAWDKERKDICFTYNREPFYSIADIANKLQAAEDAINSGVIPEGCTDYPCFTAGTLVMTDEGYRPIEELRRNDKVLTHTGSWKPIRAISQKEAQTRVVKVLGSTPITTTDEHPFWSRQRYYHHFKAHTPAVRKFREPQWIFARDLTRSDFIGQVLPPVDEDNLEQFYSEALLWIMGRYVADGWRNDIQKQAYICCSLDEMEDLDVRIEKTGFPVRCYIDKATARFRLPKAFYEEVKCFGKLAHGKSLPMWVLSLSPERAKVFLDGYLSGDGHFQVLNQRWISSTVSKKLALDLALLTQRAFGVVSSLTLNKRSGTHVIEGRKVNQRLSYTLSMPGHQIDTVPKSALSFVEGKYGWKPLRSSTSTGVTETVYNIQVADDESYMVEGLIVHNCPYFYLHAPIEAPEPAPKDLDSLLDAWREANRKKKIYEGEEAALRDMIKEYVGEVASKVRGSQGITVSTNWVAEKEVKYLKAGHWETRITTPRERKGDSAS